VENVTSLLLLYECFEKSPGSNLVKGTYCSDRFLVVFGYSREIARYYVKLEVFTAVTMKNGVFWDVNTVWLF
jgi:hypothetical protein